MSASYTLWRYATAPRLLVALRPFFFAVLFWAFAPEFRIISRQTEPSTSPQDAGSKRLIAAGQGLAALAAFSIAATVPSARLPHRLSLFWAGLAAIIGGSLLRRHCWRMLGASFTGTRDR